MWDHSNACLGKVGVGLGTRSEWGLAAADGVNRHVIQLEMLDLNTIWYVQGRLLGGKVGVCRSFARRVCGAAVILRWDEYLGWARVGRMCRKIQILEA